jgi:hypothetical protein
MRRWILVVAVVVGVFVVVPAVEAAGEDAPAGDTFGVFDTETGWWYLRYGDSVSGTESTYKFLFGVPGDVPIIGDWDCDGWDTPGYYRPSTGWVNLRNSLAIGYGDVSFYLGQLGDIPLAGDFNGDGCDTVLLYRPSEGRMFVFNRLGARDRGLGAADYAYYYGNPIDKPFAGDFDGDGIDTVGLHRESTGQVFLRNSNTQGIADIAFYYGNPGDRIIAADWIERSTHGFDSVGVLRPYARTMMLRFANTQGIADVDYLYGNPDAVPIAGRVMEVHGWVLDKPPLKEAFSEDFFADPTSGECVVTIDWGDWRGPLYASMSIHTGRRTGFGHSDIITIDGKGPAYRYTFDIPPASYSGPQVTISTADTTTRQAEHWIGHPTYLGTPGQVDCG